jgi:hypothetical protein
MVRRRGGRIEIHVIIDVTTASFHFWSPSGEWIPARLGSNGSETPGIPFHYMLKESSSCNGIKRLSSLGRSLDDLITRLRGDDKAT